MITRSKIQIGEHPFSRVSGYIRSNIKNADITEFRAYIIILQCSAWEVLGRRTLKTPLRTSRGQCQWENALPRLSAALSTSTDSVVTVAFVIHPTDDAGRLPE